MTFPETIRKIQARLDDILEAYRAKEWRRVWALFRSLMSDIETAKHAGYVEEVGR